MECMYVCNVCMHACMYVCNGMEWNGMECKYVCMYVCNVCMYVCMYVMYVMYIMYVMYVMYVCNTMQCKAMQFNVM